jgi:uncharacterized delta-60 repeat protein
MGAVTKLMKALTRAARIRAAIAGVVEPLESRVLFTAGDLDTTFGGTGTVSLNYFNRNDLANAVAVQSDGKVIVAGTTATGITAQGTDVALARYNVDGTLDTTFGVGGTVTTHLGGTSDSAFALVVQADGRVLLAGGVRITSTLSGTDFALVRYNTDGSLDTTFGTNGMVRTDLGSNTNDVANAMKLTSDGRIVLAGSSLVSGSQQFAAARYLSNGALDTSFGGGDGFVVMPFVNGNGQAKAVATLADGSMILAGTLMDFAASTGSDYAAIRLLSDGTLDTNFGAAGWTTVHLGGQGETANGVLVTSTGAIVLVGESSQTTQQVVGVARLTAAGQLDDTFGAGLGFVTTNFAGGINFGAGAVLQGDGKIVVAGTATVNGLSRFAVARYESDGALDDTFASGGKVTYAFAAGESFGKAIAADGQGRLVVVGNVSVAAGNADFAVMRLENQLNVPPTAHAGGPYLVNAGGLVVLDGSGSSDVDGSIVSYEWDFDYDGATFHVDGAGVAPTFSAEDLTGPAVRTVALRVTDNAGASHLVTTTLTVNASPTAHAGGPYLVNAGGSIVLDGSGSGDVDGSVASYEWDFDYDGSSFDVDGSGANPTFSAAGVSGPALRTIALRVTDNQGAVGIVTALLTVNALPTGHAGGSYVVNAGGSIVLDGSGSGDVDGSIVSYEWDLNYDGSTFNADAIGASATFSAAGLSGPGVRTVALRVTDDRGATHLVTTIVTINAAPTANAGGAYTVVAGQSVQLNGSGSGDVDGSVVSYEWDFDYDGTTFSADATGATPTFSAAGLTGPSVRTVALRVTDNNGATSIITTTVTVTATPPLPGSAVLVNDPANPGRQMLVVHGTAAADRLKLTTRSGAIEVLIGNHSLGVFAGVSRIVVEGGDGDDVIDAGGVTVPVLLFGGAGNDKLTGGSSHDVLVGNAGDDQLDGTDGNDILVGSAGRDDLDGRYGDDLLVGASLAYENDAAKLHAVLSEWSRTDLSLAERMSNLLNGGGRNGAVVLSGGNLVEDNAADMLSGTEGSDWLLSGPGDNVKKLKANAADNSGKKAK